MRKDEFATQAERDAWQMGFNAFEKYRGPAALPRVVREVAGAAGVRAEHIHPLSMELIYELMETQPKVLHKAIAAGFVCAIDASHSG